MMKKMMMVLLCYGVLCGSCTSESNRLFDYYCENATLHEEMRIEGLRLLKKFPSGIVLKKNTEDRRILFTYLPGKTDAYKYDYLDSSFKIINRSDKFGDEMRISKRFLNHFANSIYRAIRVDSGGIFFAEKQFHNLSAYQVGTYYLFDSTRIKLGNVMDQLYPEVYLYKDIIP